MAARRDEWAVLVLNVSACAGDGRTPAGVGLTGMRASRAMLVSAAVKSHRRVRQTIGPRRCCVSFPQTNVQTVVGDSRFCQPSSTTITRTTRSEIAQCDGALLSRCPATPFGVSGIARPLPTTPRRLPSSSFMRRISSRRRSHQPPELSERQFALQRQILRRF